MEWRIDFDSAAEKDLEKLDHQVRERILRFLHERVLDLDDPKQIGEPLNGELKIYWKYRVGDYRIICKIEESVLLVFVVGIGHRREVYR